MWRIKCDDGDREGLGAREMSAVLISAAPEDEDAGSFGRYGL
jgi:hypothetical protein